MADLSIQFTPAGVKRMNYQSYILSLDLCDQNKGPDFKIRAEEVVEQVGDCLACRHPGFYLKRHIWSPEQSQEWFLSTELEQTLSTAKYGFHIWSPLPACPLSKVKQDILDSDKC